LDVKAKQNFSQASLGNEAGRLPGAEPLRLPLALLKPVVPLMVNMKLKDLNDTLNFMSMPKPLVV
jgi:hypothetical protein